jgi:hypothetical protein
VQNFQPCLPAKAVELLAMDPNDVADVAFPAENQSHYSVKFWEFRLIRHRQEADHHGAHLMQNCP